MIKISFKQKMRTHQGVEDLDVDLKMEKGEFITLFGRSGAGKTTFLRVLAGLTDPYQGYIEVGGRVWFDSRKKISLSVQQRKVGFVFQEYSLFPNMSIRKNLEYALTNKAQKSSLDQWIKIFDLKGLEDQRPESLSGGQKQRVALARALVSEPQILLLDEPLSALDIDLRLKLQDEIVKIYQKTKITTILVSHDLSEVFKLSGRILVLDKGKIIKSGSPSDVFVGDNLSGKFKFSGEIVGSEKDGVMNILTVRIGNNIVKVVATDEEIADFKIGEQVIVASKAFNPVVMKIKN